MPLHRVDQTSSKYVMNVLQLLDYPGIETCGVLELRGTQIMKWAEWTRVLLYNYRDFILYKGRFYHSRSTFDLRSDEVLTANHYLQGHYILLHNEDDQ